MAIQYAGGSRVNYTFTDAGTRADLVSKLETQLGNAGWSTISGAGTSDVLMKTAVTPEGLSVRARLYDPGSGNCAQFTLKKEDGSASSIAYLLPASAEWRIVANKYAFYMFRTTAAQKALARGILMGGTIWAPSNIVAGLNPLQLGWLMYTGSSDTDAVTKNSWRNRVGTWGSASPYCSTLMNDFMVNYTAYTQSTPVLSILTGTAGGVLPYRWLDDSRFLHEAWVAWSSTSGATGESKFVGQLHDAAIMTGTGTGESTVSFDGHTWILITDVDGAAPFGTLAIAID